MSLIIRKVISVVYFSVYMKMAKIIVELAGDIYAARGYNPTISSKSDVGIEFYQIES